MAQHTTVVQEIGEATKRRLRANYVENLRDGRKVRPIVVGGKRGKGAYKRSAKHRGLDG